MRFPPSPPPQNPSHAPHCFVCLQHRCSVALLLAKPAVCGAPCLVGCMFLGVVLDTKSAPEISSQPQDLTDSFIEGTAYPFFESSALKIHMQTISSLPFQGVLVMCICQLPDAPRFRMTINVNKRDKHYPGILSNPSGFLRARIFKTLHRKVLKSPSPRLLSRCLISPYLVCYNKLQTLIR